MKKRNYYCHHLEMFAVSNPSNPHQIHCPFTESINPGEKRSYKDVQKIYMCDECDYQGSTTGLNKVRCMLSTSRKVEYFMSEIKEKNSISYTMG